MIPRLRTFLAEWPHYTLWIPTHRHPLVSATRWTSYSWASVIVWCGTHGREFRVRWLRARDRPPRRSILVGWALTLAIRAFVAVAGPRPMR